MTSSKIETVYVFARLDDIQRPVGRYQFVRSDAGRSASTFEYAGSWLQDKTSFPLDPVNLPLQRGPFASPQRTGLFGPLADATPDAWGRRLIAAECSAPPMSPAEWLLATGDERVGCLTFSESREAAVGQQPFVEMTKLDDLAQAFEALQRGDKSDLKSTLLYRAGRSLGGARPKVVVELDNALWIAKFQKRDDEFDQCMAEHAAMRLARDCGVDACETRIVDVGLRRAVLVRRFDRAEGRPYEPTAHYLSALSLLNLDETSTHGSYSDVAQQILKYGARPHDDRRELFARMVFNVACGNRDDHLKNHALLHTSNGWRLSPAFDVLPQPDMYPDQAIGIGRWGTYPTRANCLSLTGDFGLTPEQAEEIVGRIAEVVSDWRERFKSYGADDSVVESVARAFTDLRDPASTLKP